ncbi:MAG: integrase core domain-containing protein [Desulfobacteraceae bacterium]|nr:integrase core domain-containing protein [Desulfobacteraceae bacterium]
MAGEIFYSITEAQIMIERWRWHYNQIRPHGVPGYKPPTRRYLALSLHNSSPLV